MLFASVISETDYRPEKSVQRSCCIWTIL